MAKVTRLADNYGNFYPFWSVVRQIVRCPKNPLPQKSFHWAFPSQLRTSSLQMLGFSGPTSKDQPRKREGFRCNSTKNKHLTLQYFTAEFRCSVPQAGYNCKWLLLSTTHTRTNPFFMIPARCGTSWASRARGRFVYLTQHTHLWCARYCPSPSHRQSLSATQFKNITLALEKFTLSCERLRHPYTAEQTCHRPSFIYCAVLVFRSCTPNRGAY